MDYPECVAEAIGSDDSVTLVNHGTESLAQYFEQTLVVNEYERRPLFMKPLDHLQKYRWADTVGEILENLEVTKRAIIHYWAQEEGETVAPEDVWVKELKDVAHAALLQVIPESSLRTDMTMSEVRAMLWEHARMLEAKSNPGETLEQIHLRKLAHRLSGRKQAKKPEAFKLLEDFNYQHYRTGLDGAHPDDTDSRLVQRVLDATGLTKEQYFTKTKAEIRELIWSLQPASVYRLEKVA